MFVGFLDTARAMTAMIISGISHAPDPPIRAGSSMVVATGGVKVTDPAKAALAEHIANAVANSFLITNPSKTVMDYL